MADIQKIDDICPIHQTPMVKVQNHVGDGRVEWSEPFCSLCDELKATGKYDAVAKAVEAEAAQRADRSKGQRPASAAAAPQQEPAGKVPVIDSAAPAAKT